MLSNIITFVNLIYININIYIYFFPYRITFIFNLYYPGPEQAIFEWSSHNSSTKTSKIVEFIRSVGQKKPLLTPSRLKHHQTTSAFQKLLFGKEKVSEGW